MALQQPLKQILFFDIETASEYEHFEDMPLEMQAAWRHKHSTLGTDLTVEQSYEKFAPLYPEFGRVVCISCGVIPNNEQGRIISVKAYSGEDEVLNLTRFVGALNAMREKQGTIFLCGHNIKNFDIPFIAKRLIIKKMAVPRLLSLGGVKPWELTWVLDTMDYWKMGAYKGGESIKVLAPVFGIPTPKDDIDGSMVSATYYEGGIERIAVYCNKDVVATAQLLLAMNGESFEMIINSL